mgnify:CR=1 FL=1
MVKRIYVGNLPWSITKIRLEELFSSFGEVEDALVISDKYTGRSRGFGFITFKKDGDADKAISEMNEKEAEEKLKELELELFKESGSKAIGGTVKNPGRINEIRRTIARIRTIRNQKKGNR